MAQKFGFVAVVGQPNVGKSTLINGIVGQKVSIVSSKPQTTRRRVVGIAQHGEVQLALVDTPGIHEPHNRLGRAMVEQARGALGDVDAILVVVDASRQPNEVDRQIAALVRTAVKTSADREETLPVLLCLNKMDKLKAEFVVEHTEAYEKLFGADQSMLTQATTGANVEKLVELIAAIVPEGEPAYPLDEFTDQSTRFLVGEIIREKVLISTRQEVPHSTAVQIETWEPGEDGKLEIGAAIIVEKASQRGILIGKGGQFIKKIGMEARAEVEAILDQPVYLDLHVVVRDDWRQNPRLLRELEYID